MGSNLDQVEPRYTRHVRAAFPSLDALFAAGEEVRALVDHPGWAHVTAMLDREVATIDRRLDGNEEPLTQAQYALAHGRRSGLRGASEVVGAILHRYATSLEAQRQRHEGDAESSPDGS